MTSFFLIAFVFLLQCHGVNGSRQDNMNSLITYLFEDYQPEVRPTNYDSKTSVYLDFALLSIQDLDEKNQVLESSVVLTVSWLDPWLLWNTSDFGDIRSFRYSQERLWLPDLVVMNSVESQEQLGYKECPVRIESDGSIIWKPTEILKTGCDIDVTYYPFDTQHCNIILGTWISTNDEIEVDPFLISGEAEVDLSLYSKSGTWDLVSTNVNSRLPDLDNITVVAYSFTLKRLRTFYVVNIILPVLFLSFTASMVFYLPSESGEKMGMSITVLLSFAVYLTIISENMPQTSLQTSILSVYLSLLLAVTAQSVLMSAIVLNLHHRPEDERVGKKTTFVTRKIRSWLRMDHANNFKNTRPSSSYKRNAVSTVPTPVQDLKTLTVSRAQTRPPSYSDDEDEKKDEKPKMTWQIVSATLDRVCFVTYSVFIVLLTVIMMLIFVIGS